MTIPGTKGLLNSAPDHRSPTLNADVNGSKGAGMKRDGCGCCWFQGCCWRGWLPRSAACLGLRRQLPRAGRPVKVEVDAPAGTIFTLARVLDPAGLFSRHQRPAPAAPPAGASPQVVRSVKLARQQSSLNFGCLPSGVYVVRTGQLSAVVHRQQPGPGGQARPDPDPGLHRRPGQRPDAGGGGDGAGSRTRRQFGERRRRGPLCGEDRPGATAGPSWPASATTGPSPAPAGTATPLQRCAATSTPTGRSTAPASTWISRRCCARRAPCSRWPTPRCASCSDPRIDEEVLRRTLNTDATARWAAGLDLPAGARLGEYYFVLEPAGRGGRGPERHRRQLSGGGVPETRVRRDGLAPTASRAVQGDKVTCASRRATCSAAASAERGSTTT